VIHFVTSIMGICLLVLVLRSMIRIALMNRHYRDLFAGCAGRGIRYIVRLRLGQNRDKEVLHSALLWVFPTYMIVLILIYFTGAMAAFVLLYWGLHAVNSWHAALLASGSALNTLGFATPASSVGQWLAIPEGALGLGIVVFLFTFIPGYQALIRLREDKTSWLYVRAGEEPTGVAFLEWCQRSGITSDMRDVWEGWEEWFRTLADTHSVMPMLSLSPSVQIDQSWVRAATAVLDAGALTVSSLDTKDAESALVCVRTGTRAFLAIAAALGHQDTGPMDKSSFTPRESYETARTRLVEEGWPMRKDAGLETSWQQFLSLRGRYEAAVRFVARQTYAPLGDSLCGIQGPSEVGVALVRSQDDPLE
jgi:hypothetical protein